MDQDCLLTDAFIPDKIWSRYISNVGSSERVQQFLDSIVKRNWPDEGLLSCIIWGLR